MKVKKNKQISCVIRAENEQELADMIKRYLTEYPETQYDIKIEEEYENEQGFYVRVVRRAKNDHSRL